MHLRTFAAITIGVLGLVAFSASFSLMIATTRLRDAASSIAQAAESVYAAEELEILLLRYNRELLLVGLVPQDNMQRVRLLAEERHRWLQEIKKHIGTNTERELTEEVFREVENYHAQSARLIDQQPDPLQRYLQLAPLLDRAYSSLDQLVQLNRSQAEDLEARATAANQTANLFGFFLITIIVAALGFLVMAGSRLVYSPLLALRRSVDQMRSGGSPVERSQLGLAEIRDIAAALLETGAALHRHRISQLRFIAAVAHELRNPLNAIAAAVGLMQRGQLPADKQQEVMHSVARQVESLNTMVNDLLDTASIESGKLTLRKARVNLTQLASDVVKLHERVSPRHSVALCSPEREIWVDCDALRLSQVITNLVNNAIKYSPLGGRVVVESGTDGNRAFISVSDEGIGVAEEDQQRIFEPFRRTAITDNAFAGLGLGLSVCRKIVEAHTGAIVVESDLERGSVFRIFLALSETEGPQAETQTTRQDAGS